MVRKKRIYKKGVKGSEYDSYHGKKTQILRRSDRVTARRKAERKGLVRKGDNREVDHVGNHRTGRLKNVSTRVVSRESNRAKQPKRT
jgi:hypothetical protein